MNQLTPDQINRILAANTIRCTPEAAAQIAEGRITALRVQPIALRDANQFIAAHHRHARPVIAHKWSIGLWAGLLDLRGVAIVARPVSRALDDGQTVEVSRLATDGTRNACSMLYAAACREARRRGYQRVITYTLATETGASLKASGFRAVAHVKGRQWDNPSRRRKWRETPDRTRWERATN